MTTGTHALQYSGAYVREDVHVTGRRVVATLIDGIILAAVYNFLVLMFGEIDHPRAWEWNGTMENVAANVAYGIGVVTYYVGMEGYLGRTFGKMATGITIVREGGSGAPGFTAALIRTVLRIVDGLLGYAVAFVTVLVSDKRQRLGDMAARTQVVLA